MVPASFLWNNDLTTQVNVSYTIYTTSTTLDNSLTIVLHGIDGLNERWFYLAEAVSHKLQASPVIPKE